MVRCGDQEHARRRRHDHGGQRAARADFTAWCTERTGAAPDQETVEALAYEWVEGTVPGTEHVTSPERIRLLLALAGDWGDDQLTESARRLLPDWVHWNAEQTGLAPHLLERSLAAAAASPDEPAEPE